MRFFFLAAPLLLLAQNWPQAGGPSGTWQVTGTEPPIQWSVTRNQNLAWRIPRGHKLRVSISTTYFPLMWPAPETRAFSSSAAHTLA